MLKNKQKISLHKRQKLKQKDIAKDNKYINDHNTIHVLYLIFA